MNKNNLKIEESYPKATGDVQIIVKTKNQPTIIINHHNKILRGAKVMATDALLNDFGDAFLGYVNAVIIGTNGVESGSPKVVDETRTGLFGTTLLTKPVIASRDETTRGVFTFSIGFDEGNGEDINEMALVMADGTLYSMTCFGSISKDDSKSIVCNWYVRQA